MPHRFHAHLRDDGAHRAQPVPEAASAIEAAVLFLESHPSPEGDVAVIVEDCDSGARHCFTVDLGSDTARPC